MTPTQYLTAEHNFITSNSTLFQQGDIFDPCAEPENGLYWQSIYGSNWGWQPAAPNTATNDFNSFIVNTTNTADAAFSQIGVTGVITTIHSTNEWFAVNPALYASTVTAMGHVTIDTYPDEGTTDPTTAANDWLAQLNAVESYRNVPVVIGEIGYDNSTQVSDSVQHNVISAELAAIQNLTFIQGLNYWAGVGGPGYGGYTNIFTGTTGNWSARPAANDLANYFSTMLTPSPTPTPLPVPSINTQPTVSYSSTINVSGTKDSSITTIFINDSSAGITYPDSGHWQLNNYSLSFGTNSISIYGEDSSYNQTSTTSISINRHKLGDINGDSNINLTDFSIFALDWLHSGIAILNSLSDMNGDGVVNLTDLSVFSSSYGK